MTTRKDVEVSLADYKHKLTFTWKNDCVIITKPYDPTPKGKDEWTQINNEVKGLVGKWVSLGKDSHWVVPLETGTSNKQQVSSGKVVEEFGYYSCPKCGAKLEIGLRKAKVEGATAS